MPPANVTVTPSYKDAPATTYTLTVTGGSGGGKYAAGEKVTITANAASEGKVFDKWTASVTGGSFASDTSASTTFTMPAANVTVTATYKAAGGTPSGGNPGKLEITSTPGGLGKNLKVTVEGGHWLTVQVSRNGSIAISSIQAPGSGTVTASFSAAEGSTVQVWETEGELKFSNRVPTGKILNTGTTTT